MGKKKKRRQGNSEKEEYYYNDEIHHRRIVVTDDLRPIMEKMDRRTRYVETDQYCQNDIFRISDLLFIHEKYKSYIDKGYDLVLYKICAEEFWNDMASVLTHDEMIFLNEIYLKRLDEEIPFYKMDSYEKNRSRLSVADLTDCLSADHSNCPLDDLDSVLLSPVRTGAFAPANY